MPAKTNSKKQIVPVATTKTQRKNAAPAGAAEQAGVKPTQPKTKRAKQPAAAPAPALPETGNVVQAPAQAPAPVPPAAAASADTATEGAAASESEKRLPAIGTVLKRTNRSGAVAECTVEEAGCIRYKGVLHKSLSGAAVAAAADLGLSGSSFNGWVFWGLTKPSAPVANNQERLRKIWTKFSEALKETVPTIPQEGKAGLRSWVTECTAELNAIAASSALAA